MDFVGQWEGQADKQLLSRRLSPFDTASPGLGLLRNGGGGADEAALSTSSTFSSKDSELTLVGRPDCGVHPSLGNCPWSQGLTPIFTIGILSQKHMGKGILGKKA